MSSQPRSPARVARRRRRQRSVRAVGRWLTRLLALAALVAVAIALYVTIKHTLHKDDDAARAGPSVSLPAAKTLQHAAAGTIPTLRFRVSRIVLPIAVQDATGGSASGHALMVGGTSTAGNSVARASRFYVAGLSQQQLKSDAHNAGVIIDGAHTYIFGGDEPSLSSSIDELQPGGVLRQVGELPGRTAQAGVAIVHGTMYIVGGYDGTAPLTTIVAWKPGSAAQVVGRLPVGLRDPAVASAADRILIVGGQTSSGVSRGVYVFTPKTDKVRGVLALPNPLTGATAVAARGLVYVFGGSSTVNGTPSSLILVFDPEFSTLKIAGSLPGPVRDATAMAYLGRIVVAGGVDATGKPTATVYVTALR